MILKEAWIIKKIILIVLAIVMVLGLTGCGKPSTTSSVSTNLRTTSSAPADPKLSGKLVGVCAVFSDKPGNTISPQSVFGHDAYTLIYSAKIENGLPVLSYWGNPIFKPTVTYVGKGIEWDTPHENTSYKVSAGLPGQKKFFQLHAIYQLKDGSFYVDPETSDTSYTYVTDANGKDVGPATVGLSKEDPHGGSGTFSFEITINPQPDDSAEWLSPIY